MLIGSESEPVGRTRVTEGETGAAGPFFMETYFDARYQWRHH